MLASRFTNKKPSTTSPTTYNYKPQPKGLSFFKTKELSLINRLVENMSRFLTKNGQLVNQNKELLQSYKTNLKNALASSTSVNNMKNRFTNILTKKASGRISTEENRFPLYNSKTKSFSNYNKALIYVNRVNK